MWAKEDPTFIELLLRIGNGVETFIFDDNIKIPSHMLVPFDDVATSLDRLIRDVYPNLDTFIQNPYAFVSRAILTPKNDCVDELNDLLMERFPGKMKEYVSFNATTDPLQQGEYEDYLNTVSAGGLPPHILKLKKNSPIMLLRNLNPIHGLCNGTRLICRELGDNFIKAEIVVGDFKGNVVFIPRIPLEASGIYLREPVFSHGQLDVALPRAKCAAAVSVLIHPGSRCSRAVDYTKNIVYHEIFKLADGLHHSPVDI
ncbi:hypothetical protein ABFS83_09G047100 [Erythranthe nasuta]